ncbi:hypothetical protein ES676_03275 [Bizionia saleffrena]|uniref:Uncharacterized protein n=1 Tax=Bizionia saleffrena TaxID=291189 RepID=A0A8H2LID3_9FLAO|nr:hypothetical protein [Bizionia saleffrena]TYB77327.1 hypothetical protein ES676_03275 [Bizionia saleffrena]
MKRISLSFLIIIFSFSCSESDDAENQTTPTEANFYALTVGNSWVYKNYKYDDNTENYENTGVIDSLSIVDTQDVSGHLYYKFRRLTTGNEEQITLCNSNGEHFKLLRENEGNLINEDGAIQFTNNDFDERLIVENQWGSIYETLTVGDSLITVEAGVFTSINSERYAKSQEGEPFNGLDHFYYADGVGLIYDSASFVNETTPSIIRRLDSYNIQY